MIDGSGIGVLHPALPDNSQSPDNAGCSIGIVNCACTVCLHMDLKPSRLPYAPDVSVTRTKQFMSVPCNHVIFRINRP